MPSGHEEGLIYTCYAVRWWMIFFNLHCEKNNSAENLQYEKYQSNVRKTFLLRKVCNWLMQLKNCNWLMLIKESPFLNDTCASTYLKECLLSWPRSKWLPSVLPKVLLISVNQEHAHLCESRNVFLRWPKRLWSTSLPPQRVFSNPVFAAELSHLFGWMY